MSELAAARRRDLANLADSLERALNEDEADPVDLLIGAIAELRRMATR